MNLLDTASLVVTPNGYKASKLYSIIPSDGTGDMTFARTGDTATRVNSSGLIETVLANKPRLDYLGSSCPKLLLEPQRTNVALQSQDISSASWSKFHSPTILTNVAVAPDGTTTADSIQSDGSTDEQIIYQDYSVSANSTNTFSLFVKKATSKTNFGGMRIFYYGGTLKNVYVAFDEVNGTLTNLTSSTITPTLKVEDYGTYWRFIVAATDNGSNTLIRINVYGFISTNGTTQQGTGSGSARTIWGAQLEAGAYATSYIPTTTASVTRNADSCSKTGISSLIGQTEGTFFLDININSRLSFTYFFVRNFAETNYIGFAIDNTKIRAEVSNSGSVIAAIDFASTSTGRFKLAIAYKANDFVFYLNGSLIGTDTSGTVPTCDIFTMYYNATNSFGINSSAIWKTRLQNAELATLTTL